MQIKIINNKEIYKEISDKICSLVKKKPNCNLCLATGSSPIGVYDCLVDAYKNKLVSFKNVNTFNLDEYYPIDVNDKQSFHYFMNQHLFNKIDINPNNIYFPSLDNDYDKLIESKGGIDFMVLGIGSNGHIAFNEPNTPFDSLTRLVKLADSTIKDNSRFFNDIKQVPTQAITMGLASILKAKEIVIIVTGKNKALALKQLLSKKIDINFPASILNKHDNVTIYADKEAASLC